MSRFYNTGDTLCDKRNVPKEAFQYNKVRKKISACKIIIGIKLKIILQGGKL